MSSVLDITGLSRVFGGIRALTDVTISVRTGDITALIGPNGAGKTTAFNIVSGLIPPSAGRIVFNGRDITRLPSHRRAAMGIARTFQNIRVFPGMSVRENVMVGLHTRSRGGFASAAFRLPGIRRGEREMRARADEYLALTGLIDVAHCDAASLAFGRQRTLEIARALALDPTLLLLDEPAAGLNSQETARLGDLIRSIRDRGVSVLLVEHDMELVMTVSDIVHVLNNGILIAGGSPSEVQRNPEVITAYLGEA